MRAPYELVTIFQNRAIVLGAINSITEGFPMGEAYRRMILRVCVVYNWGNSAAVIPDGVDCFLHGLTLRTSRGWTPFNSVPGRALRVIDHIKCGVGTTFPVFAGADYTAVQQYNLWFSDPLSKRPEDTLLDTSLFNKLQLDLNFGTVTDWSIAGASGTDAITSAVMDLYVERVKGKLPAKVKPVDYVEYGCPAPVLQTAIEMPLERASNSAYKRLYVQTATTPNVGSGFTGAPDDAIVLSMGVDSDKGELIQQIPWLVQNTRTKQDYQIETAAGVNGLVGWNIMDFCQDKSNMSALISGYFSRLRVLWTAGAAGQVSCAYEALKRIM